MIGHLLNDNRNIKLSENIKIEFDLKDTHKIYWLQIIDALPRTWKGIILKDKENTKYLVIPDHFSFKKCQIYSLNKLASKDLDLILDDANSVKAAAEDGAYVPV